MLHLLRHHEIDEILDVGANIGQYASYLRKILNYNGKIISIEPLADAYAALQERFKNDPKWVGLNIGLGDVDDKLPLNVAGNSVSSSLLKMKKLHIEIAPESEYAGIETVQIRRIDDLMPEISAVDSKKMLKLDVQGYESRVLRGAAESLKNFRLIQAEISLATLYEGEESMSAIMETLGHAGFSPVGFEPALVDMRSGEWLQADIVFANRHLPTSS
jgi:hypothetical protein